tara:strand:- start:611 stop:916 length:306 start_codon:yes stop_codon:yes gene_type:complete
MFLHPFNRHLLIDLIDEQAGDEESSGILLPEDYQKKVEKFAVAEVVEISEDCSLHLLEGDFIVVDRAMVDTVDIRGMSFNLILENYVYGRIDEGDEEEEDE